MPNPYKDLTGNLPNPDKDLMGNLPNPDKYETIQPALFKQEINDITWKTLFTGNHNSLCSLVRNKTIKCFFSLMQGLYNV